MSYSDIEVKIVFKVFTFEEAETSCKQCRPARTLLVANYDCIYFPSFGETCIQSTPLKVIMGDYKSLKQAKEALYRRNVGRKIDVTFVEDRKKITDP